MDKGGLYNPNITLGENSYEWFFQDLPDKCTTSVSSFFRLFLKKWHDDENDMESLIEDYLISLLRKEQCVETRDDKPIQIKNMVRLEEPISSTIEHHIPSESKETCPS